MAVGVKFKMAASIAGTGLSMDQLMRDSCGQVDTSHLRVKGAKGYQSANFLSRVFWL